MKVELKDKPTSNINFENLDVGTIFLVSADDSEPFVGMKVAYLMDYEPKHYILDLSECIGEMYDDWDSEGYNIIRILDMTLKEN